MNKTFISNEQVKTLLYFYANALWCEKNTKGLKFKQSHQLIESLHFLQMELKKKNINIYDFVETEQSFQCP